MGLTKKGAQWWFGMMAHADTAYGLAYTLVGTPAKVSDVTVADGLLHG